MRPAAAAAFRNGGTNPASYNVTALPVLGSNYGATVDVGSTSNALAFLVGYASPFTFTFGGRTLLVNIADPGGELLGGPSAAGDGSGIATFSLPVPNDGTLCGLEVFTQALHFGGGSPYVLGNAQDLTLGD